MRVAARALGVLVLASLAFGVRELRLKAFAAHLGSQRYEDVYYLPPSHWLPVLSVGYTTPWRARPEPRLQEKLSRDPRASEEEADPCRA